MTTHEITMGEKARVKSARHLHQVREQMEKHIATIDNATFAAEQLWRLKLGDLITKENCEGCLAFHIEELFGSSEWFCIIRSIREMLGDRVKQHDIPYPVQDEGPIMPTDPQPKYK